MITPLNDPHAKQALKDDLLRYLYDPVWKQWQKTIEHTLIRNCRLMGYQHRSFLFSGHWYCADSNPAPRVQNRLSPELVIAFRNALDEVNAIERTERPYVEGCIVAALNLSNSYPDYLKLLPDALAPRIMTNTWSFHSIVTLTPEQIDTFKLAHANSLNLLRQRLVRNLLV
jgi:hypothetical protein